MTTTARLVLAAAVLAALAWIDPLYLPLIALGPLLTGAVAGARGAAPGALALVWLAAGLVTLVLDLAINGEDALFHLVVALLTAGMAAAATAAARGLRRRGAAQAAGA